MLKETDVREGVDSFGSE